MYGELCQTQSARDVPLGGDVPISRTEAINEYGDVTLSPLAVTIALLTAAGLIAIGVFAGYPIATAFTVTGAVVGVGLAFGGSQHGTSIEQL